ncbi:MAG TPA: OsmC family peroxiredoxin [Candidatus Syntrophoarchaeum butanivorans]|uniref:OsmC family peroxiredoxin n=2 Tax=Candidatus Syntropharchaeum butanivorans TaxID=1839936 RepID=A0A7J2RZ18_9EURY|nr:OsmC family peroxiredoxin [Candidatus Syntrophoarchaeum butanivorans]
MKQMTLRREGKKLVGECTSKWQGGVRSQTTFGEGVPLLMDEPREFLGSGEGPTPMEVMLASISGCAVATFAYIAEKKGVKLEGLNAIARGEAIRTGEDGWRIKDVDMVMDVKAAPDVPSEQVEECFDQYQRLCPIKTSIEAGIPVRVSLNLREEKR